MKESAFRFSLSSLPKQAQIPSLPRDPPFSLRKGDAPFFIPDHLYDRRKNLSLPLFREIFPDEQKDLSFFAPAFALPPFFARQKDLREASLSFLWVLKGGAGCQVLCFLTVDLPLSKEEYVFPFFFFSIGSEFAAARVLA